MQRRSSFVVLPLALLALQINSSSCLAIDREADKPTLENYCIKVLPEPVQQAGAVRSPWWETGSVCGDHQPHVPTTFVWKLTRPEKNNIVAIMKIENYNPKSSPCALGTLNPAGLADYGPIPPLQQLTPMDADRMWGPSKEQSESNGELNKTYMLDIDSGLGRKRFDYELDVVFKGYRLQRYRVRCERSVPKFQSEWSLVGQEKGGAQAPP